MLINIFFLIKNQMESLNIKFNSLTKFQISKKFTKFDRVRLSYINFIVNYKNIKAELYNNKLYLTNTFSVTLSDGLYDIDSINKSVLSSVLNTKYYKIEYNPIKTAYSVVEYLTINDWTNGVNGTVVDPNVVDSFQLNKELYNGLFLPQAFKIVCSLFDIHENLSTS